MTTTSQRLCNRPSSSLKSIALIVVASLLIISSFFSYSSFSGAIPAYAQTSFNTANNLSSNSGVSSDPAISASSEYVYVAWSDSTTGNKEIMIRASTDAGKTFGSLPKGEISNTPGDSTLPRLASSSTHVYVIWTEIESTTGKSDIFFAASHDASSSFDNIKKISSSGKAGQPQIVTSREGQDVYIIWSDIENSNREIFFAASHDAGESFDGIKNLSNNGGTSDQPQIAADPDGDIIYVVWRDTSNGGNSEILFSASQDGGSSFTEVKNISETAGTSGNPRMSISGTSENDGDEFVYVTWTDWTGGTSSTSEIFFAVSQDSGNTFGKAIDLSNSDSGASFSPDIASSGSGVYIMWRDVLKEVYLRVSTDGGGTFEDAVNLSNDETESGWPDIEVGGEEEVYAVWRAGPLPGLSKEVFARYSDDGAETFDDVVNVSNSPGTSGPPEVALSGGSAYIVWSDTTTGNGDIYITLQQQQQQQGQQNVTSQQQQQQGATGGGGGGEEEVTIIEEPEEVTVEEGNSEEDDSTSQDNTGTNEPNTESAGDGESENTESAGDGEASEQESTDTEQEEGSETGEPGGE